MANGLFDTFQEWMADRGIGQYPIPRNHAVHERRGLAEQWVHLMMLLLWLIVSVAMVVAGIFGLYVFYELAALFW